MCIRDRSNAVIIAFNVKPSKEAKKRAEMEKISISNFNIIYEVLDFIRNIWHSEKQSKISPKKIKF